MNIAGQGTRMISRNPDNGGGLFRSGSKGQNKSGLFAAAGFMDLVTPARMEMDPAKGMPGENSLFGTDNLFPPVDVEATKVTMNMTADDLAGEEQCGHRVRNDLDGLIEEMDRSLVAGTDPSELLTRLLQDDIKVPGGIVDSDTPDPVVLETAGKRTSDKVRTGFSPDEKGSVNTAHRGIYPANGFSVREQGMFGGGLRNERTMSVEGSMTSGAEGRRSGKMVEDIDMGVLPEIHRGVGETDRPGSTFNGKDMSGDAPDGKLIENLSSGASLPVSGQTMREMEDSRLKMEREPVRAIQANAARDDIQEQIHSLQEPGVDGSLMKEPSWTVKDEFLEMVGRQGTEEFSSSRVESRETLHENVAAIHPSASVNTASDVKKIGNIQRSQLLDTARQGLMEQVGNVVSRNGVQEIKILLSPPELGEMKIRVEVRGKRIRASFLVESAAVKSVVDYGAGRLADAVMNEGFVLENLDVSVNDTDKQTDWNMSDDDMPVGGVAPDSPAAAGRRAGMIRNDSGGIDLLA